MSNNQLITTCLWFDGNAEEAVRFYTGIFKNSRVLTEIRNPPDGPGPEGSILTITFELDGRQFMALNGGPMFKFTEAISMMVNCDTQEELDAYWEKLSEGGEKVECGWVKDKFGLAWQIVPSALPQLLTSHGPEGAARVLHAVWKMEKLDIATLERAAAGNVLA